jgi:hypothetical protein
LSEAEPLKKPSAPKPPAAKNAPAKPSSPFRAEYEGKVLKKVTVTPTAAAKEKREDDAKTLKAGLNDAIRPAFEKMLEKHKKFFMRVVFTISYDNSTGNVIQVSCEDLTFKNAPCDNDNIQFLVAAANALRSQFRFKKMDESGFNFFKAQATMGVIGSTPP